MFVADFVLPGRGRFLKFNEGNLDTSNIIVKPQGSWGGRGLEIFLFAATFEAGDVSFIFGTWKTALLELIMSGEIQWDDRNRRGRGRLRD